MLIHHFTARNLPLPPETESHVLSLIGKFLAAEGGLNEKGQRVFASDLEVLAAAKIPWAAEKSTQFCQQVGAGNS